MVSRGRQQHVYNFFFGVVRTTSDEQLGDILSFLLDPIYSADPTVGFTWWLVYLTTWKLVVVWFECVFLVSYSRQSRRDRLHWQ